MATRIASLEALINADTSGFMNAMGGIKDTLGQVGGLLTGLGATALFGAAINSAIEAQKVHTQLNAVLKSTGGIAGITAKEADKLASSLQKVTTFDDETVLSAENLLLTFTSIGKNVFPDATESVLDMAAALGEDTKSAAIQLGKALNDPVEGVTALKRVGVSFNAQQMETIKLLVETGQKEQAQKLILKELATEFGGTARAMAGTFGGKLQQLKNQFDDLLETIGNRLIPILSPLITKFQQLLVQLEPLAPVLTPIIVGLGVIGFLSTGIGAALLTILGPITLIIAAALLLKKAFDDNFLGIRDTVNRVVKELGPIFNDLKKIFDDVFGGKGGILENIRKHIPDIDNAVADIVKRLGGNPKIAKQATDDALKIVEDIFGGKGQILKNLALHQTDINAKVGDLFALFGGSKVNGMKLSDSVISIIRMIFGEGGNIIKNLQKWGPLIQQELGKILAVLGLDPAILTQLQTAWNNIQAAIQTAWDTIRPALEDFRTWIGQVWERVQQAVEWIVAHWGDIRKAFEDAIEPIKAAIKPVIDFVNSLLEKINATIAALRTLTNQSQNQSVTPSFNAVPNVRNVSQLPVGKSMLQIILDKMAGRATGGHTFDGSAYKVAEHGPELFMPTGKVFPMINGNTGNGAIEISGPINVYGVQDAQGLLDQIEQAAKTRNRKVTRR